MKKTILATALLYVFHAQAATGGADQFDWNFSMSGDRAIQPSQVFTDGKKTYVQPRSRDEYPVIIAGGKVVEYEVKFPYIVFEGVEPSMTIEYSNGRAVEVTYQGYFASGKTGKMYGVATPKAVNKAAALPEDADQPAPKFEPQAEVVKPKPAARKVARLDAPNFSGEFITADFTRPTPAVLDQPAVADSSEPDGSDAANFRAPQTESQSRQEMVEPSHVPSEPVRIVVDKSGKVSVDDTERIMAHIKAGGSVVFRGFSNGLNEASRVSGSNRRADKAFNSLVAKGVSKSQLRVDRLTEYKAADDDAGLFITLEPIPVKTVVKLDTAQPGADGASTRIVVDKSGKVNHDDVEKIMAHVKAGGMVIFRGFSNGLSEDSRVAGSNRRADKAYSVMLAKGIAKSQLHVDRLTEYKAADDDVGLYITLAPAAPAPKVAAAQVKPELKFY